MGLVQQTALQEVLGASNLNFNMSANITPGNMVIVPVAYYQNTHVLTVTAAGQAPSFSYDLGAIANTLFKLHFFENSVGGSNAITIASTGTSFMEATAMEFSGVLKSGSFGTVTALNSSAVGSPSSLSTGLLAQAKNLAITWTSARVNNIPSLYAPPPLWTLSSMNVQKWNAAAAGGLSWLLTNSKAALAPAWAGSPSAPFVWGCRTIVLKMVEDAGNPIMMGMNS